MINGFNKVSNAVKHRLILAVSGHERQGKSSLALSAPGPIAIFDLDKGLEGVASKFTSVKDIYQKEYKFSKVDSKDRFVTLWSTFRTDYYAALENKEIKTIVIDTATAAWDLVKLARLGSLGVAKEQSYKWGPVNAEFLGLIDLVKDTDKNLVLLHKLKKVYVDDIWKGDYERSGFSQTGYAVHANIDVYRDGMSGAFYMKIENCRQNSMVSGLDIEIPDPLSGFSTLGQLVFPETSEEDWS